MRGFKYILILLALCVSAGVWGQYNPANPAEPGAPVKQYTLTLAADPSGGGTFNLNATTQQTEGTTFWVQANTASNFTFVNWTDEDGDEISNVYRFQYTMPSHDAKLIAHFTYTPNAPGEPSEAIVPPKPVYAPLWLTAQPAAGCSFNIASGNNYEVGTNVSVKANVASNFKFVNWTKDGVEISTANPFGYTMLEGDEANQLVANFSYEPGSPVEPTERLYHKVFLISNPAGGGTFNVASGNEYEQGTNQTFRAYNNTWYTFRCWTLDDEEVSTNSVYTFPIPEKDITLVAHFDYNYNPGNPAEPASPTAEELALYGMTQSGVKGQTINYPVILENTAEVPAMTVVVKFPEGFTVQTDNTALSERTAGKTLTVTPVPTEGNAYRFDITGGTAITGNNGKVFDVPVTISETATEGTSYEVVLKNGARINSDESTTVINSTRKGYIYVEEQREDGLYASFTFDKFQNRFQFKNQSSDKALDWVWNFGDGTSSTERNPMHTYATEGSYDVTLTVNGVSGTDVAMMTVLVNNKNTWRVNGTLFLDTETKGVRYFTSSSSLLDFMSASPINSDVTVMVKQGETFTCPVTSDVINQLSTIQSQLDEGGYMLTLQRNGGGTVPTMSFGNDSEMVNTDVVNIFAAMGKNLVIDNVNLKLCGVVFDPTQLEGVKSQSIKSGEQTTEVDFSPVTTGLTFEWTATDAPATISGYTANGTGNIPQMTLLSSSTEDVHLIYNVVGKKGDEIFCSFTHTINISPALDGDFTSLTPEKGASIDATTITLQWNGISNAVYDVYLWNAVNQKPSTPMATGISETSFTSTNFCQNHKSYKWQIVARNATQQIVSDEMNFSVNLLPNLHVSTITLPAEIEAGTNATIKWTVRNDGIGGTNGKAWTDRVWLVPDVYGGTGQKNCLLLKSVANAKDLASGEEYEGSAEISLTEEQYGSYYILVASDMSSVTSIDWEKAGGSIVNPYEPSTAEYGYLMANTEAAGNLVKEQGETATRSDNFFYIKTKIDMPQMVEEEWNLLKQAYQEMGNGEGWTKKWDFDVERRTVQSLPGVSILGGHVVSINLSNNGVTGTFPYTLLSLPKLESLNLSENQLTGDIGEGMETFLADKEDFTSKLTAVNLANNQLGGNIGKFAKSLTDLTTLYASDNCLADVTPAISSNVTTLTLKNQTIDKVITIDVNNLDAAVVWAQIPTVLLYDHATQGYAEKIRLACADTDSQWSLTMDCTPTSVPVSPEDFDGPNAKVLATTVVDDSDQPTGSTLKVEFLFVLPNLHVSAITLPADLEAGTKPVIKWTVRNDGAGSTGDKAWKDRVWIVSNVTGGTGETDCRLLAEINNVKSLASGEEYEGSAEIDLLDEEQYGEYYFLVASDMSSVTDIDWATAGGSIVNPYEPATAEYGYLMANTEASGNLVREDGETSTRSDNFFYVKATIGMPQVTEEEWNMLKDAYQEMGDGDGWTKTWDFDVEKHTVESLPGVSILGGHVVSINLSNNGLTGEFPFSLLALPNLETLNLSENQLTGDIGTGMTQFLADKSEFTSKLTAVNIANNQLSGNISTFAQPLTDLSTLYASDNCLADVTPAISSNVTTLTLKNQTIDKVITIDVNNLDAAVVWAQIPTVLLYDHATQGYAENIRLLCDDTESGWNLTLDCTPNSIPVSEEDFDGPSDKVITASVVDGTDQPTGSALKVKFLFTPTGIGRIINGRFTRPMDVYNMQGAKVATKVISLDELPEGTYIIGGKKVAVKR